MYVLLHVDDDLVASSKLAHSETVLFMEFSDDNIIYDTTPISVWDYFLREGKLRDLSDPHRFSGDLHIIYEGRYMQNEKKKRDMNNELRRQISNSELSSHHKDNNQCKESTSWNDFSVRINAHFASISKNYCFHYFCYEC